MSNEDRTKLLIVIHRLNIGGVQKSLINTLKFIDYDKFDVTLYVRQNKCELLSGVDGRVDRIIVNDDKNDYYRTPEAISLGLKIKAAKLFGKDASEAEEKLRRSVIDNGMRYEKNRFFSDGHDYDVAVSYIQSETAEFVAKYINARHKVVLFHGSVDEGHAIHDEVFPLYDRIAAMNSGCADMLKSAYSGIEDKVTVIGNYVDPEAIRTAAAEYSVNRDNRLTLCTCGRFTKVKGFDLAVDAAAYLERSGMDFMWYFVGDGAERVALEKQITENGLSDRIIITGYTDNPYPFIAACDIYVQPSREESFGLAIREAQILSRPIVSTATVGGKELVINGRTGLLADIGSDDLYRKIMTLSQDEELRKEISDNLSRTDYSADKEKFRGAWDSLLSFD